MKEHDKVFYEQIAYLIRQYRDKHIKSVPDLMRLIQMLYGDYIEFYPDELPETRYDCQPNTVSEQSGREPEISPSECREDVR